MGDLRADIKIFQERSENLEIPTHQERVSFSRTISVTNIKTKDIQRTVELSNDFSFEIPLSTSLDIGDKILFKKNEVFVICENGLAKVYPYYNQKDSFDIGNKKYSINIKQISNLEELDGQKYLSSFHYRNGNTFGRSAKLVAISNDENFPKVLGYIELNIASIMNKPRNKLFDSYYNDGSIGWYRWDFNARGKYSKSIVSISRVVVHPDFRGLNIGKILLNHSFQFARDYWKIRGIKPIFVEIVADMLKFMPFARNAGMIYIGQTEGNIKRLKRDLRFFSKNMDLLLKNKNNSSLVRMQSHYARQMFDTLKANNMTIDDLISLIDNLEEKEFSRKLSFLQGIVRLPKPTYMIGLNDYAQNFLETRIAELCIKENVKNIKINVDPIKSPIILDNVSVSFKSCIETSEKTQLVKEAFGVLPEQLNTKVLSNFNFTINPGEIVLITGYSGTGKTVILETIKSHLKPTEGRIVFPKNVKLGVLKKLSNNKPLVELIGKSVYESLYILNKSGLSEAYLYLRRFNELSNGQQYRAMIAKLIDKKCNVWIADEFLNSLDFVTANIVASNIRNLVKKLCITLIVSSANTSNFIDSLKPDKILVKDFGSKYKILKPLG